MFKQFKNNLPEEVKWYLDISIKEFKKCIIFLISIIVIGIVYNFVRG